MADANTDPTIRTSSIRDLNDRLRKGDPSVPGRMVVTTGVQALLAGSARKSSQLIDAIRSFDGFGEDNDPHGEHDFGALDFAGSRLFWKIDYYAPGLEFGSEDPSDPQKTFRMLTIMLVEEY
jgi:hypothetical protein